ncbi:thiol reductant ABC exporter subunit CydD [bacterium]|nr:thiol reductant ABC exporter subunit CydD [bacterium]
MFDKAVLALPHAPRVLALLMVTSVLEALATMAEAWGLARAIDALWGGAAVLDATVVAPTLGFLAAFVARQAVATAREARMDRYAHDRVAELRVALLRGVYDGGPALVQASGTGAVTTAAIEGLDQVERYVGLILPKIADLMAIPTALLVFIGALDWVSALICLVMLPCIVGFMVLLGGVARQEAERQHDEYERLSNHFVDTLRGLETLRLLGRAGGYGARVRDVSERFREATVRTLRVATTSSLVLDLFATFGLAAVAIMLGFRLMSGDMRLLPALAALVAVPEFFRPVRQFAGDFHASLDGRNALAQVNAIIAAGARAAADGRASAGVETVVGAQARAATGEQAAMGAPAQAATDAQGPQVGRWSGACTLELRGVGLTYPAAGAPALRDVSLRVSGAARVGVIGPSGSGKSTLVGVLAGFMAPTAGTIGIATGAGAVEGPSALRARAWRDQVAYLPQDPHLFHATLRENVTFYRPEADEDAVARAVAVAGLDELVATLPQGLDTVIGDAGRQLSGGQAQRIALARAFLDDRRRVLLFDEPTAHLDVETELALKRRMLDVMDGRLVVFATHRLHWVRDMDLVVVLERGRVAQVGTPEELRASEDGAFVRLAAQLRGGERDA